MEVFQIERDFKDFLGAGSLYFFNVHPTTVFGVSWSNLTKQFFSSVGENLPTSVNTVDGSEIPFPTTWDGAKTYK